MVDTINERRRAALTTIAVLGATIAGIGFGALLGSRLANVAWGLLALGIVIHLFGMVGNRRLLSRSGYVPGAWERVGYWACWAVIAAIAAYIVWALLV